LEDRKGIENSVIFIFFIGLKKEQTLPTQEVEHKLGL